MDSLHAQRPNSLDTSHIAPRQDTLRPSTALHLPPIRDSVRISRPLGGDQVLIRGGPPGVVSLTQDLQRQTSVVDLVRCPEPVYPRGIYATHEVLRNRLEPCLVCLDQGCPNDGCSETSCPAAMWTTTVCRHGFHLQCLFDAIRNQPEPLCPFCSRNLSVPGRVHGIGLLERRVQASTLVGVPCQAHPFLGVNIRIVGLFQFEMSFRERCVRFAFAPRTTIWRMTHRERARRLLLAVVMFCI